jgi:hypothetical protein
MQGEACRRTAPERSGSAGASAAQPAIPLMLGLIIASPMVRRAAVFHRHAHQACRRIDGGPGTVSGHSRGNLAGCLRPVLPDESPPGQRRRRKIAGSRRLRALASIATVIATLAVGMLLPQTEAVFTRTTQDAGNSFTTATCFYRATVQGGSTTSTANGVRTVAIASIDPTMAFLLFSTRHDLNRPVGSEVSGRIASATTLEFNRGTDEASPVTITIEWSVVEYSCGVTVQRGSVAPSAATTNVTITPVNSLAAAFVTWSKVPNPSDTTWGANDPLVGELTSLTNLQLRQDASGASSTIYWQVVEFTDATKIDVQRGNTSLTGGATSTTATLGTAVTTSRTFVLAGARRPDGGVDIGSGMVRASLTNSTTITFDRSVANYDVTEISWQAIELKDGSAVQSGAATLASGAASTTATITTVDLAKATSFLSTQTNGGQNGGRTAYVTDDIIGVACATAKLTSTTQLTLARTNTAAAASFAWFVVSWGLPV